MNNKPLIILAGPTAVGKTALSIELAKKIDGEIVSADSVQVYKKLNIGSAKIRNEEMQGIKHYLIDVLEPEEEFNVAIFKDMAKEALEEIYKKNKIPILAGGTGFYIQALLKDVDFSKGASDENIRKELESFYRENGTLALHEKLSEIDKEAADSIPEGNVKRVIRAIEYYRVTGEKISVHNKIESEKKSPYNYHYFVLNDIRSSVYDRINKRVDKMMEDGLLEEVKYLYDGGINRDAISMQSLGYRQIMDYLYGDSSLEEAIEEIRLQTRHFAKRQITWFKREKDTIWINKNEFEYDEAKMLDYMLEVLGNE